mgnify:CR=1 FL=1|tara:strand:+ start:21821 stop:22021 length:201 start_codon:yes stop_codon:yes gene_type:complete
MLNLVMSISPRGSDYPNDNKREIDQHSYHKQCWEFGDLLKDQEKRLKELKKENTQFKETAGGVGTG